MGAVECRYKTRTNCCSLATARVLKMAVLLYSVGSGPMWSPTSGGNLSTRSGNPSELVSIYIIS
jgi:hypothetical protein